MTDRERLIELQRKAFNEWRNATIDTFPLEFITDYLLANGVIVPLCKVGDIVYVVSRYYAGDWEIYQCEVESITHYKSNTFGSCVANDVRFGKINFGLNTGQIGKTVFLTKEEAEQALKERDG